MATITSSSTYDDAKEAFLGNLSYSTDGSVAKCKAFIEACKAMIILLPQRSAHGSTDVQFSPENIHKVLAAAEAWLARYSDPPASLSARGIKHVSFEGFRS